MSCQTPSLSLPHPPSLPPSLPLVLTQLRSAEKKPGARAFAAGARAFIGMELGPLGAKAFMGLGLGPLWGEGLYGAPRAFMELGLRPLKAF